VKNQQKKSDKLTINSSRNESEKWTIRHNIKPGDQGYLIYLHGIVYSKECGWDETFEAYVAKGLAEFVKSYNLDNDRLWLAEMEGQIIGSIAIEGHSDTGAQLHWYFVHPDHRDQGLGKELMSRALEFCKDCGYTNVFLWTTKELEAASHIYLRFGFRKTEDKAHKIWGKDVLEQRYDLDL
jgi:GNAT superfamily N-acetyltransferase